MLWRQKCCGDKNASKLHIRACIHPNNTFEHAYIRTKLIFFFDALRSCAAQPGEKKTQEYMRKTPSSMNPRGKRKKNQGLKLSIDVDINA